MAKRNTPKAMEEEMKRLKQQFNNAGMEFADVEILRNISNRSRMFRKGKI